MGGLGASNPAEFLSVLYENRTLSLELVESKELGLNMGVTTWGACTTYWIGLTCTNEVVTVF